jgi:outer membrane protein assembly factor BamB
LPRRLVLARLLKRLEGSPILDAGFDQWADLLFLVFTLFPGGVGDQNSFSLVALEAQTGALAWRASFGLDQRNRRAATSVVNSGGVLYISIGGTDVGPGELIAVNEQSGAALWAWKTVGFISGVTVMP